MITKLWPWKKLGKFNRVLLIVNLVLIAILLTSYFVHQVSPIEFWALAFLGLAYPVLLLIHALFIFYWTLIKTYLGLYSLVAILLGWNMLSLFFQINLNTGPINEGKDSLKVLSYNVRLFDLYDWTGNKKTRNMIFEFLEKENADIICFQEFFYHTDRSYFNTRDSIVAFLKAKNYNELYTHNIHDKHFFGLATFTSLPIVGRDSVLFGNDPNNACVITDIVKHEDTIRVFNVHLSSIRFQKSDYEILGDNESAQQYRRHPPKEQKVIERLKSAFHKRTEQVAAVKAVVNKSPYPTLICGDFNDTPFSYAYGEMVEGMVDAFCKSGNGIGGTYIGSLPSFRIDYILHSTDIHSYDFTTHDVELSDHKPISCKIQLK